ncbi:GRAM domain-containing protein 2B [Neolamprologus brichardi]|uniref:GRAM domain-containing protein 2B n=1 Tax=Neolamprologus brichardi TaxID=32507 RepID=UPI001643E8FB|nr:GRAM domain-containing protein 2B [Neolamprologus brichardi]
MTEQCGNQQTSQEDARKCSRGAAKHEERDSHDHSLLTQVQTDPDSKIERKKSHYSQVSKTNCQYHKIFKEISKEEQLRQSKSLMITRIILYFVSQLCLHTRSNCSVSQVAIPVVSIKNIKKTKTAILLPNALVIATTNDRYVFVSFLSRDNTYKFLMSICPHLEGKSPCSSPLPSSAENSFRSQRSPLSPRFPLVGQTQQKHKHKQPNTIKFPDTTDTVFILPTYNKIYKNKKASCFWVHVSLVSFLTEGYFNTSNLRCHNRPWVSRFECFACLFASIEFTVPPFLDMLKHTDSASSPDHQHKVKNPHLNQQGPDNNQHSKHHRGSDVVIDSRCLKPVSLNTLLMVYMFLVCTLVLSSCYLAFKIISLEQRLTTLGTVAEFTHPENNFLSGSADVGTNLLSELLTINLMKLEKVQKNLQRLLEEAA